MVLTIISKGHFGDIEKFMLVAGRWGGGVSPVSLTNFESNFLSNKNADNDIKLDLLPHHE